MIVIIDYQMGNIGAIVNMLKRIGIESSVSSNIEDIKKADKLILPGVGSFDEGIKNLEQLNLISVLSEKVIEGETPILGICLGMQLFSKKSEEGILEGLGWIDGEVKKFKFNNNESGQNRLKIPHTGWNTITIKKQDVLFEEMPEESRFYFVHSYHFNCGNVDNVLATTDYGYEFSSIIKKENIIGVQFHPEKSHKFGMKLLKNFVELC
jgi:glutamine amidotransferase